MYAEQTVSFDIRNIMIHGCKSAIWATNGPTSILPKGLYQHVETGAIVVDILTGLRTPEGS